MVECKSFHCVADPTNNCRVLIIPQADGKDQIVSGHKIILTLGTGLNDFSYVGTA